MTTKPRSIAWRLYAFATLIVIVSLGTLVATALIAGKRPERRQMGPAEALAHQLDARFPDDAALVAALHEDPSLRGLDLFVYDRHGRLIGGVGKPLGAPTQEELHVEDGAALVETGRITVAMGPTRVMIHRPAGEPTSTTVVATVVAVICMILVLALAATLFFTRTIVRPLRTLGDAARAFGRGETSVRTRLSRRDELGAVGHAFDEMADKIEQLLRTQRSMMADISHELRTPLTRIKLALDLASADPQAAQQVLDDVGADLEEIEQIIEDVFDVVRLDSDSAAIRRKELDLVEIVHRSAARFGAHHTSHPLVLETTLAHARYEGDGALIRRSLDNLLDNAAKYSPDGTPVALRLREHPDTLEIEVVDQGIGMTTGELALAFTPFWRADQSRTRETGGVGLGLALARRIARAHGGDVELESSRASGTIARLTLSRR